MSTREFDSVQDESRPGMYSLRKLHECAAGQLKRPPAARQTRWLHSSSATR